MTRSGWEGLGALLLLMRFRLRARLRGARASLRQPKRVLLVLLLATVVAVMLLGQHLGARKGPFGGETAAALYPLLFTVLLVTTVLGALAQGVLAFDPAEVQFLFPAPLGTRALLAAHVLGAASKSLSGAFVFALFLRPPGSPFLRTAAAYVLFFLLLVLLGLAIDLFHIGCAPAVRKRRATLLGLLLLVVAGASVLLAARAQGGFSLDVLLPLGLPAWPLTAILAGQDGAEVLAGLAVMGVLLAALSVPPLTWRGNVRDAARSASERMQRVLERAQKGQLVLDSPRAQGSGRLLPMLPRWGGAGAHAWRQLTALLRLRKSYVVLLLLSLGVGASVGFSTGGDAGPEAIAGAVLGMLAFAGPSYVQCDFRADYDILPWLRSLPTPPTALAAGQLLAAAGVLWVLELLAGAWIVLVAPAGHGLLWTAVFALLPCLNLIQLAIENGVYLLYPTRQLLARGPPGAVALGRLYALLIIKFATVFACVGIAALIGWAVSLLAGTLGGALAGALVLALEAAVCVWLVGRIFVRLDVSRDLTG